MDRYDRQMEQGAAEMLQRKKVDNMSPNGKGHILADIKNGNIADKLWDKYYNNNENEAKTDRRLSFEWHSPKISLAITLVTLLISLTAMFFVLIFFYENNEDKMVQDSLTTEALNFTEVCIECRSLMKNPYNQSEPDSSLDSLNRKQMDGVLKCCASTTKQVSTMLEVINRGQEVRRGPVDATTSAVSAHKNMISADVTATYFKEMNTRILRFDPTTVNPFKEHVTGVDVLEDGLVILYTGVYFVYSSVSHTSNTNTSSEKNTKTLISYINRMRPNDAAINGKLLQAVHTQCENCKSNLHSDFTGGVFLLNAGDFLQVFVNGNSHVNFNKESTYLGLAMIGNTRES